MRAAKPSLADRSRSFLDAYTHGLKREDLQRLFTRDTREAYRFFAKNFDEQALSGLPRHRRGDGPRPAVLLGVHAAAVARASRHLRRRPAALPARLPSALPRHRHVRGLPSFFGPFVVRRRAPASRAGRPGTTSLFIGFLLVNLLDPARGRRPPLAQERPRDRPRNPVRDAAAGQVRLAGASRRSASRGRRTRSAATSTTSCRCPDGRVIVTLGDVSGKGSPAALLMALLLAMFRTLVDEGLEAAALAARLNVQVCRHSPASRFITLFFAACDPATGRMVYVNAGHMPALLRRRDGTFERLTGGGIALGMFDVLHLRGRRDDDRAGRHAGALQRRRHRGREPQGAAVRGVGPRARRRRLRAGRAARPRRRRSSGSSKSTPRKPIWPTT